MIRLGSDTASLLSLKGRAVVKVSKRGQVQPFLVMDVMRAADELEQSGANVLHLEVGQPSVGIPESVARQLQDKIQESALGYTVASGLRELKHGIAQHYLDAYDATVPVESIVVTTGSSAGFQLAFLSAFDAGDRVAMAAPGYPAYRHILESLSLEPVLIEAGPDTRFQVSVEHLMSLDRPVDGLILASPSNPTGTMVTDAEFNAIADYCADHGIRLISDEIYHGITFGRVASTAALRRDAIVINSFSKYFCMTGWRVGWLIVPPDLRRSIECLAQNHYISPPTVSQWAAVYALQTKDLMDERVQAYALNRRILLDGLSDTGFGRFAPSDGAFYLYCDVSDHTDDSLAFCASILQEAHVAITPGIDFDPIHGKKFARLSFAGSQDVMREAVARLSHWLPKRQN